MSWRHKGADGREESALEGYLLASLHLDRQRITTASDPEAQVDERCLPMSIYGLTA